MGQEKGPKPFSLHLYGTWVLRVPWPCPAPGLLSLCPDQGLLPPWRLSIAPRVSGLWLGSASATNPRSSVLPQPLRAFQQHPFPDSATLAFDPRSPAQKGSSGPGSSVPVPSRNPAGTRPATGTGALCPAWSPQPLPCPGLRPAGRGDVSSGASPVPWREALRSGAGAGVPAPPVCS